jgi:hypothetical protein
MFDRGGMKEKLFEEKSEKKRKGENVEEEKESERKEKNI